MQENLDVQSLFAGQMGPIYFPVPFEAVAAHMSFEHLNEGSWEADGARSAASWVAFQCRLPAATARQRVRMGRALRRMPEVEAAWLAGDIDEAHASPLAAARTPATAACFKREIGRASGRERV
jgi:hypothetical protein